MLNNFKIGLKSASFSVQVIVCLGVLVFCLLQIGLDRAKTDDKVWYFSTVTFILMKLFNTESTKKTKKDNIGGVFGQGVSMADGSIQNSNGSSNLDTGPDQTPQHHQPPELIIDPGPK